jgi:hypothetical protein
LQFFLKATQLEQMKMDYAYANNQRKVTMEIIEQKEKVSKLEPNSKDIQKPLQILLGLHYIPLNHSVSW